jgi:hypothetical protein
LVHQGSKGNAIRIASGSECDRWPHLMRPCDYDFIAQRGCAFLSSGRRISKNILSNGDSLSRRQTRERWSFGVVLGSGRKTTSLRDAENLSSARVSPAPLPLSEDSRTSAQQHRQMAEAPSMRFELRADTGKEPYFRSTTLMA